MCTAGQTVLLTITGPGPSFFDTKIYAGQRAQRGRCPIEQRGEFLSLRGGQGLSKGRWGLGGRGVAGGLEQWGWGLGRVSKCLGGWGLEGGWDLEGRGVGAGAYGGRDGRSFARSSAAQKKRKR